MRRFILATALFFCCTLISVGTALGQDWNSNPSNWKNHPSNWDNNPNNWKNHPSNWDNNPNRWGNDRIVRDNQGNPQGYTVPRNDGGLNIFDFQGNRQGYAPGRW